MDAVNMTNQRIVVSPFGKFLIGVIALVVCVSTIWWIYYYWQETLIDCVSCNGLGRIVQQETCLLCKGTTKISHPVTCTNCGGSGKTGLIFKDVCTVCNGSGKVMEQVQCPSCFGKGTKPQDITCPKCDGKGKIKRKDS